MRYDHTEIELRWQEIWDSKNVFQAEVDHTKPKFYCLEMFPTCLGTCTWVMYETTLSGTRWPDSRE